MTLLLRPIHSRVKRRERAPRTKRTVAEINPANQSAGDGDAHPRATIQLPGQFAERADARADALGIEIERVEQDGAHADGERGERVVRV